MDLSINKVNSSKNLNFKGVKADYTEKNTPVFKFFPPVIKKGEKVSLQFVPLLRDSKTDRLTNPKEKALKEIAFKNDESLIVPQKKLQGFSDGFAYRYKIESSDGKVRFETDSFAKINLADSKEQLNVIEYGNNYGITPKTGPMRHSFLDADGIVEKGKLKQNIDKDFVRNHFNKLQGSVKGLTLLLTQTDELDPYRYIISTPDIGADPTSSHKYWPNNLYQCSNMQDFKDLNYELFTRGKGYVADGAFTSQSLQSPLVQHVLKWGEESPWYNSLKITGRLELGVLPNVLPDNPSNPYDHIGIRVVNNPHSDNYDKNKLTHIQFYDDRLSSEKQRNDSTKLIDAYDSAPEDHYEITSNEDSVYPFAFELDTRTMSDKLDIFKNKNAVLLKDIEGGWENYLTFPNYSIVRREDASGGTFWDGNRDILKMNLSNPSDNPENIKGMQTARKYIQGVATFWTEAIQSDLILRTAKASDKEKEKIAKANDIDNYEKLKANLKNLNLPVLEQGKVVEDYISEFPLQSIETSPELSAIFAQRQFKEEFLNEETESTLSDIVYEAINKAIPEEYKNNVQYEDYVTKTFANQIIKNAIVQAIDENLVDDKGQIKLNELKEIGIKNFARNPKSPSEERAKVVAKIQDGLDDVDCTSLSKVIKEELKDISLDDFKLAETIVLQGKAGLNWRFDAAKDIGDLDEVRSGNKNFKDIWDGENGVGAFWTKYIDEVRKYNPSALVVSEITNFWDFYNCDDTASIRFDAFNYNPDEKERKFLANSGSTTSSNYSSYFNKLSCFVGVNPENHSYEVKSGDVKGLKGAVEGFISQNQPNNAMLSHTFVDNHDKPRLLHALPLDMDIYLLEDFSNASNVQKRVARIISGVNDLSQVHPKAVAVGVLMRDAIIDSDFSYEQKEALKNALTELVSGRKTADSKPNLKRAEAFGVAPYEVTIRDLFKKAGYKGSELDKKAQEFHYNMLKNSMLGIERLWQMMNAIVGTPTLFNGTEFAQTGYETPSKNVYVGNRNRVLHELKDEKGYKEFYSKMYAISDLYKAPGLSALRDGYPVSLKLDGESSNINEGAMNYFIKQINSNGGWEKVEQWEKAGKTSESIKDFFGIGNDNDNWSTFKKYHEDGTLKEWFNKDPDKEVRPFQMWPLYKYDDKGSKVISVITNAGLPKIGRSCEFDYQDSSEFEKEVDSIVIQTEKGNCPLEDGTKLKRKIFANGKYVDDKTTYEVQDGKIINPEGKIEIKDTVSTFYVPQKTSSKIAFTSIYNGAH